MALTTKPRWDKYDAYVGNFRGVLGADIDLDTEANKVLAVGLNSDGAIVVGSGQTGIKGLIIVAIGADIHGNLLDGGINSKVGDIQDVGKHGEITNFVPSDGATTYAVTETLGSGNFTLLVNGVATGNIAFGAAASAVKTALVAVDDGFDTDDFTVTGSAPDWVVTPSEGIVITAGTNTTVAATSGTGVPLAGTNYYAHADGTVTATAGGDGIYVGHTVESTRLVVNVSDATP